MRPVRTTGEPRESRSLLRFKETLGVQGFPSNMQPQTSRCSRQPHMQRCADAAASTTHQATEAACQQLGQSVRLLTCLRRFLHRACGGQQRVEHCAIALRGAAVCGYCPCGGLERARQRPRIPGALAQAACKPHTLFRGTGFVN